LHYFITNIVGNHTLELCYHMSFVANQIKIHFLLNDPTMSSYTFEQQSTKDVK